ncbi:hypothetical protein [Spirosoma sp. KUDC1026]|uniref:hypothetical protein n=1 Tax=Spirosoma sp. KUDC1026 TaxID=2745947 RepID=UPI001E539597|nr:hypothetical protein [Spirosoma sp. KUDC1026]
MSCQSRRTQDTPTGSDDSSMAMRPAPLPADTLCFRQVIKQDTTTLKLVVNGSTVSGYLDIDPFEKDQAKGPLSGTIRGNQIQTEWQRSGEGVTQTYVLTLTLNPNTVTWPEGERVDKKGRWELKSPTGNYTYALARISCP